jgi:hypothetical protein
MRTAKRGRTSEKAAQAAVEESVAAEPYESDIYEIFRVTCPDCGQPIALLAEEERLPEHGLCASPLDPFGLTVCQGSGRGASEAASLGVELGHAHDVAALLTLPAGLDWRMQPFSHAGRYGARPVPEPYAI